MHEDDLDAATTPYGTVAPREGVAVVEAGAMAVPLLDTDWRLLDAAGDPLARFAR